MYTLRMHDCSIAPERAHSRDYFDCQQKRSSHYKAVVLQAEGRVVLVLSGDRAMLNNLQIVEQCQQLPCHWNGCYKSYMYTAFHKFVFLKQGF